MNTPSVGSTKGSKGNLSTAMIQPLKPSCFSHLVRGIVGTFDGPINIQSDGCAWYLYQNKIRKKQSIILGCVTVGLIEHRYTYTELSCKGMEVQWWGCQDHRILGKPSSGNRDGTIPWWQAWQDVRAGARKERASQPQQRQGSGLPLSKSPRKP
jgi:hypothetical protein